ncbi:dicarboxylate/amino acid:cation symporter [Erysipelothrix urinaevulpis]|uniref:dicarboxylate/amino acid:cation symporter n=1 Tax=Erysipelothrix urinaevulpis TaxID=2683717 RepID=UPI00135A9BB5|nr:dicarboxylate/amino acid:cation symporter [Erysipelothrix urinaevulpis]
MNYLPIIALLSTVLVFYGLYGLKKKYHLSFAKRTFIAMAFGLLIGIIFKGNVEYVSVFGRIYSRLISSVVVPLLFFSIIASIASVNNLNRLKSLGVRSVFWLLLNALLAGILTVLVTTQIKFGSSFNLDLPSDYVAREVPTFIDTIISFFPSNIVLHAAENQIIPMILFSVLMGIALVKLNTANQDKAMPVLQFFESMNHLINEFVKIIIKLTPYAVVAYIASVPSRFSGNEISSLFLVILVGYGLSFFQAFIIHGVLVKLFAKMSPVKFFKGIYPAQLVAFTSQSSVGTVPVVIDQLSQDLEVDGDIASFVAGLGANVGMPACTAIWPIMLAVFTVYSFNIPFTSLQFAMLIVYAVIVSFGTAGVPGTATIAATAVLTAAGLPLEIIFIFAPISSLVDMARTMANVTGSATAAVIVNYKETKFD